MKENWSISKCEIKEQDLQYAIFLQLDLEIYSKYKLLGREGTNSKPNPIICYSRIE